MKLFKAIRCYRKYYLNSYWFLYFSLPVFTNFLKKYAAKSTPFDTLHHIFTSLLCRAVARMYLEESA